MSDLTPTIEQAFQGDYHSGNNAGDPSFIGWPFADDAVATMADMRALGFYDYEGPAPVKNEGGER